MTSSSRARCRRRSGGPRSPMAFLEPRRPPRKRGVPKMAQACHTDTARAHSPAAAPRETTTKQQGAAAAACRPARGQQRPAAADGGKGYRGRGGAVGERGRVREEFRTPCLPRKLESAGSWSWPNPMKRAARQCSDAARRHVIMFPRDAVGAPRQRASRERQHQHQATVATV